MTIRKLLLRLAAELAMAQDILQHIAVAASKRLGVKDHELAPNEARTLLELAELEAASRGPLGVPKLVLRVIVESLRLLALWVLVRMLTAIARRPPAWLPAKEAAPTAGAALTVALVLVTVFVILLHAGGWGLL